MYHAFTVPTDGVFNKLITEVIIKANNKTVKVKALWDTGATNSAIDLTVVNQLGIQPVGKTPMGTSGGVKTDVNQYVLEEVYVHQNIKFVGYIVLEADIKLQGIDMLIGMDMISRGNFAITHKKPTGMIFSYSVPPFGVEINYVDRINNERNSERKQKKKRK